ncbi:hypothetical protein BDV27DRAFT_158681 [Aspergillus caelatus]|uniref:Hydrophobic surface binding protein A-domain-containing protein n=1 Tax=Aspergillus caelatus TaxID=61420 RepID=A0A5N7A500_9EURO|nr:uncharacterized protein BDV27DRAFT_158681 [Aspergillus caelatus]KAE8363590.1 hypothetical protein BDV27DRAFT_158681 [Aspergillus caelatus]
MHFGNILFPALLFFAAPFNAEEPGPSAEMLESIGTLETMIASSAKALREYNGAATDTPALAYTLYSTRRQTKKFVSDVQSRESFTAADSAAVANRTVDLHGHLVDLLNIGRTKVRLLSCVIGENRGCNKIRFLGQIPLVRAAGYGSVAQKLVQDFHQQDRALQTLVWARMATVDQEKAAEGFQNFEHAYDALLKASQG